MELSKNAKALIEALLEEKQAIAPKFIGSLQNYYNKHGYLTGKQLSCLLNPRVEQEVLDNLGEGYVYLITDKGPRRLG